MTPFIHDQERRRLHIEPVLFRSVASGSAGGRILTETIKDALSRRLVTEPTDLWPYYTVAYEGLSKFRISTLLDQGLWPQQHEIQVSQATTTTTTDVTPGYEILSGNDYLDARASLTSDERDEWRTAERAGDVRGGLGVVHVAPQQIGIIQTVGIVRDMRRAAT